MVTIPEFHLYTPGSPALPDALSVGILAGIVVLTALSWAAVGVVLCVRIRRDVRQWEREHG
jgi:hypothetical protein